MDFGQGDGGFVAGERTMSSLLNELGDHRQRNNHNSNNSSGVLAPGSGNPLKLCRSASDMDFYKSREGDDHDRSGEGQGPMKLSRTDSFPFNLKMHSQHQQQQVLRNSNGSISSEGRLGYSPSNSGDGGVLFKNDPLSVVSAPGFYGESGRTGNGGGHSLLQPYYSFKTAGGAALSMPLSIGRAEATLNNNNNNNNNLGMGMMHGSSVHGSRFCFTPAQWQELEHQALIFKYMMAGVPVPTDLLIPIRKSVAELNTLAALSAPGSLHHHHPTMGWSSFNLRFANNTDPEPGRCRRTDGKKWRCSRDVAPDQKYCERHMHRGRPRSRKLVEAQTAMTTNSSNNNANNPSSTTTQAIGGPNSSSSATSSIGPAAGRSSTGTTYTNLRPPFSMTQNHNQNGSSTLGVKTFSGCGNVGGGGGMSINGGSGSHFNKPPLHMVSTAASAMPNKDYRYMNWMKGDMDEQMLFSDAKGLNSQDSQSMNSLAMLNNTWRLMPSKVPDSKLNANANNNNNNNNASFLQYTSQLRTLLPQDFGLMPETNQMNLSIQDHQQQQQQRQQHSFLSSGLGAVDSVNVGRDQCSEGQPLRHFFDDWPRNTSDPSTLSWSDMEERSNSSSNTQLSISLPMTITDFPGTNSSSPRGKLSLSSLKLSMSARSGGTEEDPIGVDPTQMGLGVGMGLGLMNEDRHRQTNNNGWIPVTWQSPVGGPLAEVLQSSTNGGGIPPRGCKTSSGLNLMSDGWDLSPHGSPRMASPTGVLQKTFASLSDSSSGSSPRAVAAAAAKHETSLQHNLGGV